MSNKRIENIIKEKLDSKQYAYDDAYWDSAKAYMAAQNKGRKGLFYYLPFVLILFTGVSAGAFGMWYFTAADSSTKLTETTSSSSSFTSDADRSINVTENITSKTNTLTNTSEETLLDAIQQTDKRVNQSNPNSSTIAESKASGRGKEGLYLTNDKSNSAVLSNIRGDESSHISNNSSSDFSSLKKSKVKRDLPETLHLELKGIEDFSLTSDAENEEKNEFSLPKLNLLAIGMYGSYQWINDFEDDRYETTNGYQFSYGAFGEYAVNHWIHLQAGASHSTEHFNLKIDPEFTVSQLDEWDVITTNEVFYDMEFQNGVPISFDSSLVTTVDSTLNTAFDTVYTDSVLQTIRGNYRINRIEIPLAIRLHHSFGRWEFFGATGANLGIRTNVSIPQSELAFPKEEEFNRFSLSGSLRLGAAIHITEQLRWSVGATTNYELIQPMKFIEQRRLLYGLHSSLIYRW